MISVNQTINFPNHQGIEIVIKREDLRHPIISGNKLRKLKYNLIHAKTNACEGILTFGGAFSNHILASAYAAKINNLQSIGIIRGEELANQPLNETLKEAQSYGMRFEFLTREDYRHKTSNEWLLYFSENFPNYFIIPEGGTNFMAVKGCEEILTAEDKNFDYICCAVGTGGTISGLINSGAEHQMVLGFPALKENYLHNEISNYTTKSNYQLIRAYHFGGYAKIDQNLISFMNAFYLKHQIPLDPIYTGKMVYGIDQMLAANYFKPNSKILIIHTGGLQGINGINQRLKETKQPLINYYNAQNKF
jgi:1-aminocyclopropane-1-carboxylate deaminase